jgi:hypothetical protein
MRPLTGFDVRPGDDAAIVVGLASTHLGTWQIDTFTVRYHVGSQHYAATFQQGVRIRVVRNCRGCTHR